MPLNTKEMHSPEEAPKPELDEEDWADLLSEAHHVLTRALGIRQPKWLTQEAGALLQRIDQALSWHRLQ